MKSTWQSTYPTRPSSEITLALNELVSATRLLGIPRGVDTGVIQDLVENMVTQARALEGWTAKKGEAGVQAAVDLGFLTLLGGGEVVRDEMVQECLKTVRSTTHPAFVQVTCVADYADPIRFPSGLYRSPSGYIGRSSPEVSAPLTSPRRTSTADNHTCSPDDGVFTKYR